MKTPFYQQKAIFSTIYTFLATNCRTNNTLVLMAVMGSYWWLYLEKSGTANSSQL